MGCGALNSCGGRLLRTGRSFFVISARCVCRHSVEVCYITPDELAVRKVHPDVRKVPFFGQSLGATVMATSPSLTLGEIVSSTEKALRHLPYFEALAAMDESSADWRATSAGLVVLRLFDSWIEEGPIVISARSWGMLAAREAVDAVEAGNPIRSILTGVLKAIENSGTRIGTVAVHLMAYARSLDFQAHWGLAADVYRTVISHSHPLDESDIAIDAHMGLGKCLRISGDLDAAAASYGRAGQIAAATGEIVKGLRARIADAKLSIQRGNLPEAESILDETIGRARGSDLREVRAIALHDRAVVAHFRGDCERAIRLAYDALGDMQDPSARDRVLADIAVFFAELGVRSAARDAHLILAATAQGQYSRWSAVINLLELAALDRCEPIFEQYRLELSDLALPPVLQAEYLLTLGTGFRMFRRFEAAREALRRAMEIASANGLNQLLFTAEESLASLGREERSVTPSQEPSDALRPIAAALTQLRTLAGIPD